MSNLLFDVLSSAGRLLFLGLLPLVGVVFLASVVGTILQASLAVHDYAFSFGIRVLALLLALYLFLPAVVASLLELAQLAYG